MTEEQLQAIEERANKASTAPWIVEAGAYSGRDWMIGSIAMFLGASCWDEQCYTVTTNQVHASELEGDTKTDAEFIANARTDVPALIAEVRSLRAKLDAVPVEELRFWWDPFRRGLTAEAINEAGVTIEAWLKTQEGA